MTGHPNFAAYHLGVENPRFFAGRSEREAFDRAFLAGAPFEIDGRSSFDPDECRSQIFVAPCSAAFAAECRLHGHPWGVSFAGRLFLAEEAGHA
ncbi:MAG: hypothetical protein AAF968_16745 [Pseudomonadota bacterium]